MTRPILALLALPLVVLFAVQAAAQGANVAFGAEDHDADQPIEVVSDRLDVNQTDGIAVFTGNVVVVQGDVRLTADRVEAFYGTEEPREIERLEAFDNVVLVRGTEAAEGETGIYDLAAQTVVMTGDVVVTQDLSVVSGDRLTVDLETGSGVIEGRVRTILRSGGN